MSRELLVEGTHGLELSGTGKEFVTNLGVDVEVIAAKRRPMCKPCLDWSMRRSHLAGSLGIALLDRFYQARWATREENSRVVKFTKRGEEKFLEMFPLSSV